MADRKLNDLSINDSPFYDVHYATMLAINNATSQKLRRANMQEHGTPLSTLGKSGFQVCIDVHTFKPSELSVKVVDNFIVLEGKHDEREDGHGLISRHSVRRYVLPKEYDTSKVVASLSSDGVLTITAPKPQIGHEANVRQVQIQQVGPANLNVKENVNEKKTEECADGEKDAKK